MGKDQREVIPTEVTQAGLKHDIDRRMERLGLIGRVSGGIQIDINAATKRLPDGSFSDAPLCDHNCRIQTGGEITGSYDCPAAMTLHPGLRVTTLAPTELLIEGIARTVEGVRIANGSLLQNGQLDRYYQEFRIPEHVQDAIGQMLQNHSIEVNLFGGNPELHPKINDLIAVLKDRDLVVNFTTTGGRFMRDSKFLERILENPPGVIALSADDFEGPEHIDSLANLPMDELRSRWRGIPMVYGQKRKAHEAVFVTKLAKEHPGFPKILFNLVVHQGNLARIEQTIAALRDNFPNAIVNPYPAQSAFYHGEPTFQETDLPTLEEFVDKRIAEHLTRSGMFVPRLHYWLMLKAVFATRRGDPKEIARSMSGYAVWRCYQSPGSGRYVQIGASPEIHGGDKVAGGHLACFWNPETVTEQNMQTWNMKPREIADHITGGMGELASQIDDPCPGCIMPRLNFDMLTLELGMDKSLVRAYLDLRKKHVGF